MLLVTFSRQSGSLGTQVARGLAGRLGAPLLDKETLERELGRHGVTSASMERYDEKKPGFWEIFSSDRNRYLHFLKSVVYRFALDGLGPEGGPPPGAAAQPPPRRRREGGGGAVFLGRGAQVLLAGISGVLHVRVIAPLETRIARLQEGLHCDRRQAEQIVRHSDTDRSGFHRFFFNVNWEDPSLYDLVLNTASLSSRLAVAFLEELLRTLAGETDARRARGILQDRCLQQEVETRILYQEKVPVKFLEAVASDGRVTLNGTVNSQAAVERCGQIAGAVPGVREVLNNLYYSSDLYGYMPHA